ncbi:MAG TPA: hypothetical protein VGK74_10710 [Symbiobacteriaceae bacterium]|jgi:hypothetical protein
MEESLSIGWELRAAAAQGDFDKVAAIANALVPGMEAQVEQFRIQMGLYAQAKEANDWRRSLRALADARLAAIAAGLTDLESMATEGLYNIVKLYEGRRA